MLKLYCFGYLMRRANPLEKTVMLGRIDGKGRRGQWLGSHNDSMAVNLSKLWEIVKDRGAWRATVHGVTKSWARLSD